jgi:ribonuclease R
MAYSKKELKPLILQVFKENPTRIMNHKQVTARLGIEKLNKNVIQLLEELKKDGKIAELERGKYHYDNPMNNVEGVIEVTQRGSAYVVPDEGDDDIFVAASDLNHALNGDRVVVTVYPSKKSKRPEGFVLEVLSRAKSDYVGVLQRNKNFSFLVPDDKRMYADIFISNENLNGAENGQKVIARLTDWPEDAKNPFGKITTVLGEPGDNNTEMHAIVAEFGFPVEFPHDVEMEAEKINTTISKNEIKKRTDFRDTLTFTIDPADAKDFDDAISFKRLDNGHFEIGVHIADVSHYVQPGTKLDEDAFNRATSVYLVDRTIPMLPEKLSNGVCSLRPNEDKLTFSAVFEMNDQGQIISQWIGKTIIHSRRRFAYEEAQERIESGEGDLAEELIILNNIAKKLKEERFRHGAINFETDEVKFNLDENGKPLGVYIKVRKDAHKLIEEYMLLANRKVAEFGYKYRTPKQKDPNVFVYRVHDAPDDKKLQEFSTFAKRFGYHLKLDSPKAVTKSMNELTISTEGKPEQGLLQSMAIRTMSKAVYTTQKTGHYGLAFDFYSHFTSPIRRYPDLMVHRLLEKYLEGGAEKPSQEWEKRCKHSSQMEQKAAEAERASIKYKQAEYLQNSVGMRFAGIVSGVTDWGIFVEITENKCEGMIRLNSLFDDFYEFNEKEQAVVGKRTKRRYHLGDAVMVKVKRTDPVKRQIDFVME